MRIFFIKHSAPEKKWKHTPDTPIIKIQMIRIGQSIRHISVKHTLHVKQLAQWNKFHGWKLYVSYFANFVTKIKAFDE